MTDFGIFLHTYYQGIIRVRTWTLFYCARPRWQYFFSLLNVLKLQSKIYIGLTGMHVQATISSRGMKVAAAWKIWQDERGPCIYVQ